MHQSPINYQSMVLRSIHINAWQTPFPDLDWWKDYLEVSLCDGSMAGLRVWASGQLHISSRIPKNHDCKGNATFFVLEFV